MARKKRHNMQKRKKKAPINIQIRSIDSNLVGNPDYFDMYYGDLEPLTDDLIVELANTKDITVSSLEEYRELGFSQYSSKQNALVTFELMTGGDAIEP